ncbi:hypothetical protein FB451DRAFT_1229275 [Mycena latifolia]|nr:hypothetical protein FB451DRAFT_1229275 [Mycena latifolia]
MPSIFSIICAAALLLSAQVLAVTYTPNKFVVVNGNPNGAFGYAYSSGSLLELASPGNPGNSSVYNTWIVNRSPAVMASLGVTNVAPSTSLAGVGYLSPFTGALVLRIFYQTTNGDIRMIYHSGINFDPAWVLDSTVIANVPLGTPLSAFQASNGAPGVETILIQYTDVNGILTQRFSTVDIGGWSAPVAITTA